MRLSALCRMGLGTLVGLARSGELRPRHLWVAMEGAGKYRDAVARGDIASAAEQDRRVRACAACPVRTSEPEPVTGSDKHWCGPRLDDSGLADGKGCGCLVALSVGGQALPAGKTVVGSERCPNGRW